MDWGPAATRDWRGQELTKGFGGRARGSCPWGTKLPSRVYHEEGCVGISWQQSGRGSQHTRFLGCPRGDPQAGALKEQTFILFWVCSCQPAGSSGRL